MYSFWWLTAAVSVLAIATIVTAIAVGSLLLLVGSICWIVGWEMGRFHVRVRAR